MNESSAAMMQDVCVMDSCLNEGYSNSHATFYENLTFKTFSGLGLRKLLKMLCLKSASYECATHVLYMCLIYMISVCYVLVKL